MTDSVSVDGPTQAVQSTAAQHEVPITSASNAVSAALTSVSATRLIVRSGELYTIESGETETRTGATIRDGGTLTQAEGSTLTETGD